MTTGPRADGQVAVVVVNYGSHRLLEANLGAVSLPNHVFAVVVDNYSTAAEARAVGTLCERRGWHFLPRPDNLGFGPAVNAGVELAQANGAVGVVLLNPDARMAADVVSELRATLLREPDTACSPRIVTSGGRVEYRGAQVQLSSGRIRSIAADFGDDRCPHRIDGQVPGRLSGAVQGWLTGACLAVGTDLWNRAGGLPTDYFLYWEDVDFSRRLERAGGRLVVRHDLTVVHDEGGTQGRMDGRGRADSYYYWNCRNRLAFAARNLSYRQALTWVARTPVESGHILLRGGRRHLFTSIGPLRAAVRGSLAGIALVLRSRPAGSPRPQSALVVHPGAELYGSDRMVVEAVTGLIERGHPVTVAVPGNGPLIAELRRHGAEVVFCRMPVLRKSALRPAGMAHLALDFLAGLPVAVSLIYRAGRAGVYVSTLTIPSWLILSRLLRRRTVCHVHEAERSAAPLVRRLLALPLLCAHHLVVNSRFSLDVLAESIPRLRDRATVVYNGVRGPVHVEKARPHVANGLQVLYVGRLSPRKGPDIAVAAVGQLARQGRDVHLALLGDVFPGYEWFADQLRVAAAELAPNVTMLGFEDDVWPRFAAADVIVVPSVVDEPFGNTAVEAVLAARPAVVSATSGLREAADGFDSVILVPAGEATALADALSLIMDAWPEYAMRAQACAEQAARRYSPVRFRTQVAEAVLGAPAR